MTALRDKEVNMIGICGMGGVGKTTIAKKIMNRVRGDLFDEVLMVIVSQPVDMLRIQDDIAKSLGLELKEGSLSSKAHTLHARLMGGKRILVVFDDVWEKLKLEDLGVPCESGQKRCTILLTSRVRSTFVAMNVQKVCALQTLSEEEAWSLFKSNVGTYVDDHQNLLSIAKEVANECKGLPIALVSVGVALKDQKGIPIWKDALHQLKSANPVDMSEVIGDVYRPLKVSYDYLNNRHARSLFLLCCLFPEDYDIPLEDLTSYAMGLRMIEGISNLEQARDRIYALVEMLKSRFLLLDGRDERFVKMHDVVRDVAVFIASEEGHVDLNLNSLGRSREPYCSDCTWFSSSMNHQEIDEFPRGLNFPKLRLLCIMKKEFQIHDNFFEGTREINVLSIRFLKSLPQGISFLTNLQTLLLHSCDSLKTISDVGMLTNLEILSCRDCDSVEELPMEIGSLNRLRLLELLDCWNLKKIVPGVISKLVQLEELKIVGCFDEWETEEKGKERENAGLRELESLSNLTCLEIGIRDWTLATEQLRLPSKIVKYRIRIGEKVEFRTNFEKELSFRHLPREIALHRWIHILLSSSEVLYSTGDGSNNLDLSQAQDKMKHLDLGRCSTVKQLVNTSTAKSCVFPLLERLMLDDLSSLEEICEGPIPEGSDSFKNLKKLHLLNLPALKHLWKSPNQNVTLCSLSSIKIWGCGKLRYLFSLEMAKDCIPQLESLTIYLCQMMEEVFWKNKKDAESHITFPKLKKLKLYVLPRLTAFCKGIESIEFPLLPEMEIEECSKLTSLLFGSEKVAFGSLKKLKISGCHSLCYLLSVELVNDCLLQLEELHIIDCKMMEQVILGNEENKQNGQNRISFPQLKELTLRRLPTLRAFCTKGIQSIEFPLLYAMKIEECLKLKRFVSSSTGNNQNGDDSLHLLCSQKVAFGSLKKLEISGCHSLCYLFSVELVNHCLLQLEELHIRNCKMMEQVILGNEENKQNGQNCITFPQLKKLTLCDLPTLRAFCTKGIQSIEFPLLYEMVIRRCPELKKFVSSSAGNNQNGDDSLHLLCSQKVAFGSLKVLRIIGFEDIRNICSGQISVAVLSGLEELEIENCKMIEEVFWNEENKKNGQSRIITFPQLKKLILRTMSRLRTFSKGIESIEFPLLTEMRIYDCPELISLDENCAGGHDDDSFHLFCPQKVVLGSLKEVYICERTSTINTIWCRQIPVGFFNELKILWICGFVGIMSLFSSSVVGNFVNLRQLMIVDCPEMVKVIANEEKINCDKSPILPNLGMLALHELPKLETFCEWRCALELPSLKDVSIVKCPQMKCLTMGPLSTPKLIEIRIDHEHIGKVRSRNMVDLNGVLKQKHSRAEESTSSAHEEGAESSAAGERRNLD